MISINNKIINLEIFLLLQDTIADKCMKSLKILSMKIGIILLELNLIS